METNNRLDEYGRYQLTSDDAIQLLLQGKDISGSFFLDDEDVLLYNEHVSQVLGSSKLNIYEGHLVSFEEFHEAHIKSWFIPWQYELMDMREILLNRCTTEIEKTRVDNEYSMFEKYELIPLLKFMKYFMDTVVEKGLVIGVGRGSSVSSYCLYLLGVHRVDSIKYDLDYSEFFK